MPKEPPPSSLPPFADTLRKFWKGKVLWNCPLAYFTTLKVGGPAQCVVMPGGIAELVKLVGGLGQHGIPWRVIGRGSNILVPDEGFAGVVIILGQDFSAIRELESDEAGVSLEVEAGCGLMRLVKWTVDQRLRGLEFAVGIPGSVGGAIVMNAGAFDASLGDQIVSVSVMDRQGGIHIAERRHIRFAYRGITVEHPALPGMRRFCGSAGQSSENLVILAGRFRFERGGEEVTSQYREFNRRRRESQPQGLASAGSFFKNPDQAAAGRLIEEAGLKGFRIGGAVISPRHANFIVNAGGATARDIKELMQVVQEAVWNRSGIKLDPEVDVWGGEDKKHH